MRLAHFLPILTLLVCVNDSGAAPQQLNIYNWSDYIGPTVIADFEAEYGIEVSYDIYDSSQVVDTKMLTSQSGFDVVFHSASASAKIIPAGVYQPVNFDALENMHHLDADIIATISERFEADFIGVPYMWGTTGLAYNVEMIEERMPNAPVHSSALVFDPAIVSKFADCGVSLLDSPEDVIAMALLYLGHPATSMRPEHLKDVEALFRKIRPYIKYFSSTKMLLDLPSEEVCIAMSWSGDYSVASNRASEAGLEIELAYKVPIEGATDWFDLMYIPADATNPDDAHLFIDYMLRPEVIARTSEYVGYANANKSATALMDKAITENVAIYPDAEIRARLHPYPILTPREERRRNRTWTRIKTGL